MSYTMLRFNKGQASLIRVLPQHRHTDNVLHNTLLKGPYSSLCSVNSDPLVTIPASNYDTTFSLPPKPLACTHKQGHELLEQFIRQNLRSDSYTEAMLCLSGQYQKRNLTQTHQITDVELFWGDRFKAISTTTQVTCSHDRNRQFMLCPWDLSLVITNDCASIKSEAMHQQESVCFKDDLFTYQPILQVWGEMGNTAEKLDRVYTENCSESVLIKKDVQLCVAWHKLSLGGEINHLAETSH